MRPPVSPSTLTRMKIDPVILEAPKAIRNCPECGSNQYAVKNRLDAEGLQCDSITCADCGFDILAAYWASQNDKH